MIRLGLSLALLLGAAALAASPSQAFYRPHLCAPKYVPRLLSAQCLEHEKDAAPPPAYRRRAT